MSKRKGEKIVATIIRTSIIGESDRSTSYFLEWVKGSVGVISGYTDHTWNGVTCLYLAQFISFIIREGLLWTGVRHLCERGRIYSKHWLAVLIKRFYYLPVTIIPQHTSPKYLDLNTCYNNSYKPPCLVMDLMEQRVFTLVEKKGFGKYVSRLTCRFCNNYTKDILHLGDHFGLAGGFLSNVNEEDKTYPLTLSLCEKCKYIQCKQVIPSDQLFKKNYFYYSSMIPSLVKHFKGLADWIAQNFPKESKIIEIGCNDGVLLYPLYERGFTQVIGVDPSRTITNVSKNITCYNSYFDNETVDKILTNHGLQDLFISCNSFAHIDNMQEILYNMKRVLQPGCGKAMIEVHYAKHIFTEKQFDFIYHEHTGYYTVSSLFHICKMNDLRLSYVEHVPNHGGSLRCIIEMKPTVMVPEHIEKWLKEEAELFEENFFIHYQKELYQWKQEFQETVLPLLSAGYKVYGYGASGRANTLLHFAEIILEAIIDDAPSKIGSYTPVYNIPIVGSSVLYGEERPDYVVVLAWPYASYIMEKHGGFGGKFILPLPEIKICSI